MNNEDESYLLNEFQKTTRATIKGTVIVALAQGFLGYLTLLFLGIEGALIWGAVMALLSIVPAVGTILVWLPIALILFANGEIIDATLLIFSGIFIIGMIDNLLRPILISKETKIPDYLILLTTIGGISIFGITGFIVGPIIASLFISIWSLSFAYKTHMENHIDNLKTIVGDTNALDREEDIHPFLEDWRGQIKGSTPLILFPKNTNDVQKIVHYCYENDIKIVSQGGNTSLRSQCSKLIRS